MPNLNPVWLDLLGQCLNLWGGVLLGLEAIGAAGFLRKLDSGVEYEPRIARSTYTGSLNDAFVFVIVALLGFAALLWLGVPLVSALLIAPLTPFCLQAVAWASERIQRLVERLRPPSRALVERAGSTGCAVGCIWGILWLPWYVLATVFTMLVRFGLDLPLRIVAERFVAPLVLRIMRVSAKLEEEDTRWHFRRNAFRGMLLILAGFVYQAIAAALELLV